MCCRVIALGIGLSAVAWCESVQAQEYTWKSDADGIWSAAGNWTSTPGDYPNSSTADAQIVLDITANRTITLTQDIEVNALRFNDTGGGTDMNVLIQPASGYTLRFTGVTPTIESGTYANHGLNIYAPIDISAAGLTHVGGGVTRLGGGITGGDDDGLILSQGSIEISGDSPNFSGDIIVESGARLQARSILGTGANVLGDTTGVTIINGTGYFETRDSSGKNISETFILNGIRAGGSLRCYAGGNNTIDGPVILNADSSFSVADWTSGSVGTKRLFYIDSVIQDGPGGPHSVYFLGDLASSSAQGTQGRLSEMILGGVSTYGGDTCLTTNFADDGSGTFSGTLRLGIDNPLPTTTKLSIGGAYSTAGGTLGTGAGNGRFVLNGHNQELAGLVANGTGLMNRVVGNSATLSTLTLNIADGVTNTYDGFLGWTDTDDNNLALVKTGAGTLKLTADNTYTGATTVNGGTLIINGDQSGATGDINVAAGASLGGSGTLGGDVTISGIHQPGNSPGVQTFGAGLDYTGGSSVVWELADNVSGLTIQAGPTYDFDQIVVAGDLTFQGTTTFNLDFNSPDGSLVNWTDTFWDSERSWLVYDVSGTTGGFENLSLSVIDWDDGGAAHLFDSIHPSGSFHLIQQGNDIFLSYAPVPEPSTVFLLLGIMASVGFRRRRRKCIP